MVFDRAYAPAPWTLPSLTSLITSSYACEHGLLDGWKTLSPTIRALAERLQESGYFTGMSYSNAFAGRGRYHRTSMAKSTQKLRRSFVLLVTLISALSWK